MADHNAMEVSGWLIGMQAALDGESDSDVPCGTCTACCASSQFVHVAPDERAALAAIPAALLFAAPGMPDGHQLMGYDEHGRCPMLGRSGCSIYDARPRTCRTFDCRIYAATAVASDKPLIASRVRSWTVETPTEHDRAELDALRAAAAFAAGEVDAERYGDRSPAHIAVRAVQTYREHLPEGFD